MTTDAIKKNVHTAEGAISYDPMSTNVPTQGPEHHVSFSGDPPGVDFPGHSHARIGNYDLDPAPPLGRKPDKGRDTYTGIPGDGIVPG